jgi:aldehyde dehydrogenase (NAD+)
MDCTRAHRQHNRTKGDDDAQARLSAFVARRREYFLSCATRPIVWRRAQLEALRALLTENHDELCDAL